MLSFELPRVQVMVPPHCYHDTLVVDVKEPLDPVNRLLEDLMCAPRTAQSPPPCSGTVRRRQGLGKPAETRGLPCAQAAALPAP